MEPGRFQDFCLRFLPCLNSRYVGLERFGHTVEGKTRRGTPDLIKTLDSGKQIAVQCGTEDRYWGPTAEIEELKPVQDILECLKKLDDPIEIVAISNREIPTNAPNAKSKIIGAFADRTPALISPIALAEISEFLDNSSEDPSVKRLIADFCPEAAENIKAAEALQKYRMAQDLSQLRRTDAGALILAIESAVAAYSEAEKIREVVIEQLDALSSCRVASIPAFLGLQRASVERLPMTDPMGKVWLLIGLPKIGKSSLLLQLISRWSSFDVRYFDIPVDDAEACSGEIVWELLRIALPEDELSRLSREGVARRARLEEAQPPSRPVVVVVDNANHLSERGLRHISEILGDLKRANIFGAASLACIFASNKRLGALTAIDEVVAAPRWDSAELRELLLAELGQIPGPEEQSGAYLTVLAERSGGHPLLSTALARKCGDISELIGSSLRNAAAVEDEDLSREALSFLYGELLSDPDYQNFVQRLSILIGRQDNTVLEAIRRVEPTVRTSVAVLLDRILTSAIEGDAEKGYTVPPVFRDIARQRINKDEQRRVYSEVAKTLLKPEGNVIQAERTISGITHAILAGDVSAALGWTSLLVHSGLDSLEKPQLEVLLDRLQFVTFIKPRVGLRDQFVQAVALVTLAFGFGRINRTDTAAEVLQHVRLDAAPTSEDSDFVTEANSLKSMSVVLRATYLAGNSPPLALEALGSIDATDVGDMANDTWHTLLNMMSVLIPKCRYNEKIGQLIRVVVANIRDTDAGERREALLIASSVARRAKEGDLLEADFESVFGESALSPVLSKFCHATYLLETGQVAESLPEIAYALETLQGLGYSNEWDVARLELARGDAAYKLEDDQLAIQAYRTAVTAAPSDSFESAWGSCRLGTLSEDEQLLSSAAAGFKSLGYEEMSARATGARGAIMVRYGSQSQGLSCLASVVASFFDSKIDAAGPAAAVALAHVTRLKTQLAGESLPSDADFPAFAVAPYETVISTARPRGGAAMAFFLVGDTYRALGDSREAREWFRRALNSEHPESELFSVPLIVERVLADREAIDCSDDELLGRCAELVLNPAIIGPFVGSFIRREFVSYCLFHDVDAELNETGRTDRIAALLLAVERVLSSTNPESYWSSEVSLRRANVAKARHERGETIVKHFRAALAEARKVENGSVMMAAGHALGFEHVEEATSLRELAEFQFALLRGIELQKVDLDQPITFGRNLYRIWRYLSYRRLSERDLNAVKLLRNAAVAMDHAGTDPELAGKVMVILLCKLLRTRKFIRAES